VSDFQVANNTTEIKVELKYDSLTSIYDIPEINVDMKYEYLPTFTYNIPNTNIDLKWKFLTSLYNIPEINIDTIYYKGIQIANDTNNLGICLDYRKIIVPQNFSEILNFEIRIYDQTFPIYKILLDFIEAQSIGDVF
jgi:hypothetical protein